MLDGEGVQAGSKALKKKVAVISCRSDRPHLPPISILQSHHSKQEIDELAVEDYDDEEGQPDTASEEYHEEGEDVGEGSHRTGKSVNKGKAVADEFIGDEVCAFAVQFPSVIFLCWVTSFIVSPQVTTANKLPPKVPGSHDNSKVLLCNFKDMHLWSLAKAGQVCFR